MYVSSGYSYSIKFSITWDCAVFYYCPYLYLTIASMAVSYDNCVFAKNEVQRCLGPVFSS